MSAKQVLFHDAARTRIIVGVNILADAVKVTRSALQNAASIASLILTTDAMIAESPKDEKQPDAMGEMEM